MATIKKLGKGPAGLPFCQGVLVDDTYYLSGVIGVDMETGQLADGGIEGETEKAFDNMIAALRLADMDLSNVIKVTVMLQDMIDYSAFNQIYARYFSENPPAREAFGVTGLAANARLEMSAIAAT